MDSKKHFSDSYDCRTFYPPQDIKFSIYSDEIWNNFLKLNSLNSKIADLGCGGGTALYCLEKAGFKNLYGVDFCNVIPSDFLKNTTFIQANVLNTSLKNESLDAVVSSMVIEHVDENSFVDEVHRVLKKNGIALITSVLKGKYAWYFYRNARGEIVIEPSHLKEYSSVSEFEDIFKSKFEIIQIEKPLLKYPAIDPLFKFLMRTFKSNKLKKAATRNSILKKIREIRIPILGYYSIEILVRKL